MSIGGSSSLQLGYFGWRLSCAISVAIMMSRSGRVSRGEKLELLQAQFDSLDVRDATFTNAQCLHRYFHSADPWFPLPNQIGDFRIVMCGAPAGPYLDCIRARLEGVLPRVASVDGLEPSVTYWRSFWSYLHQFHHGRFAPPLKGDMGEDIPVVRTLPDQIFRDEVAERERVAREKERGLGQSRFDSSRLSVMAGAGAEPIWMEDARGEIPRACRPPVIPVDFSKLRKGE